MNSEDAQLAAQWGVWYIRQLPDKRLVYVAPLTFGRAKICIGDEISVHNAWCYDSPLEALKQAEEWNPDEQEEPAGWMRNPMTGRRRPDGDPAKEHIYF